MLRYFFLFVTFIFQTLALSATDHVNPVPPRVIVHFFKTPSKAYRFHLQRHLYSGHSPSNPRSEFLPGPRQRTKISLGKTWFCPIGDVIFFFTLGNVNHFSLLPEQRVTGPLEEKKTYAKLYIKMSPNLEMLSRTVYIFKLQFKFTPFSCPKRSISLNCWRREKRVFCSQK